MARTFKLYVGDLCVHLPRLTISLSIEWVQWYRVSPAETLSSLTWNNMFNTKCLQLFMRMENSYVTLECTSNDISKHDKTRTNIRRRRERKGVGYHLRRISLIIKSFWNRRPSNLNLILQLFSAEILNTNLEVWKKILKM